MNSRIAGFALAVAVACGGASSRPQVDEGGCVVQASDGWAWLLGREYRRVSISGGKLQVPFRLEEGPHTLAIPGRAPVEFHILDDSSCEPGSISPGPAVDVASGRVFGLPPGRVAEIVGCGGAASSLRDGSFDLPIVRDSPCYVDVFVDEQMVIAHRSVELDTRLDLSIPMASLGAFFAASGAPTVVTSARDDGSLVAEDVILSIEGVATPDLETLIHRVREETPGTWVAVSLRRDGQVLTVDIPLIVMFEDSGGVHFDQLGSSVPTER